MQRYDEDDELEGNKRSLLIIKLCSETQRQNTHVQPAHVHKSFSQLGETTGRFQSCMQHRSETCA